MFYILFALFLFSCNEYSVTKVEQTEPELVVYPNFIDFGHLHAGFESGQVTFAVMNAGNKVLTINKPYFDLEDTRINLDEGLESNYIIQPGELVEFNVYYSPVSYETNEATITIVSDDADETYYSIPVLGFGDAPVITVFPEEFDYGQISIGCDNEERITIRNDGNLPLSILALSQMVTHPADIFMELGSLPEPPWELIPTQELDFLVSYIPNDINYDESIIRIESNDPDNPIVEVMQYGDGNVEHWAMQSHVQEDISYLDVIFVIDNSGSMNLFQQALESQISGFMNIFVTSGADYHLGVITTDEASLIDYNGVKWIDNNHSDPVVWLQTVINGIGVRGSGMEKGIEMAKLALEGDAGPGRGFLRESASLIIIYVSDEADNSTGGWNSYTAFFDGIKSPTSLMKHFAVIGDHPVGCAASTNYGLRNVAFGEGYYEMTQRYAGGWYSICAVDWGQQLQSLANTVVTRKIFRLDEPDPIEHTITVTVNGQVTLAWSYDSNENSVVFDNDSIPLPNQTIVIEYAIWGCGDE